MDKWIEILQPADYPQGKITKEDLDLIAKYYNPDYYQAALFKEHRKYNENGELINNLPAMGWVKAVRTSDNSLYILPENEEEFQNAFQGYRYASAEIEMRTIEGKEVPYLAGLIPTNFPASQMEQIKFGNQKPIRFYNYKLKFDEEIKMDKLKLIKILGMKDDSTEEQVIAQLTKLTDDIKKNTELADSAKKLEEALKLIKLEKKDPEKPDELKDELTKLTKTVTSLVEKLDKVEDDKVETIFNQGVKEEKLLPSVKEDILKKFIKDPAGLKSYIDKLPKLNINTKLTFPKNEGGEPLTYDELLADTKKYQAMEKENPVMLTQLRQAWLDGGCKKKEIKKS